VSLTDALRVLDPPLRAFYAWSEVTLDGIFPVVYAALLILILRLAWWNPRGKPPWIRLWRLLIVAVPVATAVADEIENVALFVAVRSPVWASGGDVAAALTDPAKFLSFAGISKFVLLAVSAILLGFGLVAAGRLGRTVTLVWLARVPIAGLVVLVAFATLGGSDQVSPTIPNLLLISNFWQAFFLASWASAAALIAGFTLTLTWERGPERVGAGGPGPLPDWVSRHEAGSISRSFPFLVFTVPLFVRALARSVAVEDRSLGVLVPGAALGFAVTVGGALFVEHLRTWLKEFRTWLERKFARSERGGSRSSRLAWIGKVMQLIGPEGYAGRDGLYRGHGMVVAGLLAGAIAYRIFYSALQPDLSRSGTAWIPTAAYVLGLLGALVTLLSAATFLFDRWRVPLVGLLALWMAVTGVLRPVRHEFDWNWRSRPLPTVGDAARVRLVRQPEGRRVLTIVTASGGGIQAAAWTARVLAGLDEKTDGCFSQSVALLSAVSGGSVGSYFTLSAFDVKGSLAQRRRQAVVDAAKASSLEETAWGIFFPDLCRAFNPFRSSIHDRGWAMERGWLRARVRHLNDDAKTVESESLRDWTERTGAGLLPAVVFNATRIEDGLPLRLSTVAAANDVEGGLTATFRYGCVPAKPGYFDLATVTAARLSATFPYVSPITQPKDKDEKCNCELLRWHVADGGYFDNHGTTAALEWFKDLVSECEACFEGITRIVWLEIDPFPPLDKRARVHKSGWMLSAFGPVLGLAQVRTGSQRVRRGEELELLEKYIEARFEMPFDRITIAPPPPEDPLLDRRDPPLSWYLSSRDKNRIEEDWRQIAEGNEIEALVDWFRQPELPTT
jgi:hypothetical protein